MGFSATLETISINKIRTDGGTQSRAAINDDVVSEYAEVITGGGDFPPVTVYFDGKAYWLTDGFHRTAAYRKAGAIEVQAEVRQGDKRAAVLHSVGANAQHGLRRTIADKRRAIETLLRDDEWSQWAQSKIADACGVSQQYVSKIINEEGASYNSSSKIKTVERDGKTYTMNTENIGGKKPNEKPKAETKKKPQPVTNDGKSSDSPPSEPPRPKSPYADLTREALEDDHAALHEAHTALQATLAERDETIVRLEAQISDLSSSDQGATISKLERQRVTLKGRLDDAMTATKREEYKRKAAERERDDAVSKLENQMIPL